LSQGVGFDAAEIALFHFCCQHLAASRVDSLTNHHEWSAKTDHNFFCG